MLAALVFGGRYVLRPVFASWPRPQPGAFTATALLVVLGTALLVSAVGLSMALGAFLAGVLLADSEYPPRAGGGHRALQGPAARASSSSPVGMSANLGLLLERPVRVAGLVLGLVAVKVAGALRHWRG